MKKTIALLIAVIMMFSLCACGAKTEAPAAAPAAEAPAAEAPAAEAPAAEAPAEPAAPAFETVVPGKLTCATSPDFAPYEFYAIGENGPVLSGFDVALCEKIAEALGLEVEVIPMDFDSILLEVQNGNIDIGAAGFSPSPERAETFDFSDLYYLGGQSFVVLEANKDKYSSFADFKGISVGAQIGSIQMGLAEENTPDADIVALGKVTDIIAELLSGKLEGAFIETAVAECYKVNYPDLCILWDVPYEEAEGSALAFKKGNEALVAAVNEVIATVLADGTMAQFVAEANELAAGEIYEGLLENK